MSVVALCLAHAFPCLILPMRDLTLLEIKCLLLVPQLLSDRTRIGVCLIASGVFFLSY